MGKTRGGRNTKLMALTDVQGRLVSAALVGYHVVKLLKHGDSLRIVGDKGFDDDKLRAVLRALRHRPCFPTKKNRKHKISVPKSLYRKCYRVENFFGRPKRWDAPPHAVTDSPRTSSPLFTLRQLLTG